MIQRLLAGPILAALLLAGCASIDVNSDRYAGVDFVAYHTYAWMSTDAMIQPRGDQLQISALTTRRIREAIEAELSAKGYRKAEPSGQADFVVAFTVGARDRITADAYPVPYRGPWNWQPREPLQPEVEVQTYREGTLSIDVFDGASRQPVWHGWATKMITDSDMASPGPVIERGVKAILQTFH